MTWMSVCGLRLVLALVGALMEFTVLTTPMTVDEHTRARTMARIVLLAGLLYAGLGVSAQIAWYYR